MLCRGGPLRHSKSVAVAESLVVDMVELAPGVPVLGTGLPQLAHGPT